MKLDKKGNNSSVKRTIFLRIFTSFLLTAYIALVTVSIFVPFIPVYKYWFSGFILFLGISLFIRYLCYHIDSNLFSGLLLFWSGVWGIVHYYIPFNLIIVISGYLIALSLSFISVFIKFRQIFHLKGFVFLSLYAIVLIMYANYLMPFWLFIFLMSIISIMMFGLVFSSIRSNMRKV